MDKLLEARILDLFDLCDKYAAPVFSKFLDGGELADIAANLRPPYGYHVKIFGGYEDAERCLYGVFPEWQEPDETDFPMVCLKITHNFGQPLSHRDYLGSLMGLGIDRAQTGDILISGNTAYILLLEDICPYVMMNLTKIGSRGISVSECELSELLTVERRFEEKDVIAASQRIDAVAAAVLNVSRSGSAKLIASEKIKVNYRIVRDGAAIVKPGDLISIRGYGRYRLDEIFGKTRKDRLHMRVRRYV